MPAHEPRPRCTATKKSGEPCTGIATIEGQWCVSHDPRIGDDEKRARARRGAASTNHSRLVRRLEATAADEIEQRQKLNIPTLRTADDMAKFLDELIALVQAGLLPASLASAINSLLNTRLKLEELRLEKELADSLAEVEGSRFGPRVVNGEDGQ